jgi:diguanylate cyclase (GGDEF)-like protein
MTDRVLFIDDEPNMLKTLRRQLNGEPYEQVFAHSAEEGIEAIRKSDFGVIISDMRMPRMTGIDVLSEAKRVCPMARRIILTGYSEVNSVISAINSAKVHAFLLKPWVEQELKKKILDELDAHNNNVTEASRMENLEEQTEKIRIQVATLEEQASHDPLTGLFNRRTLETRFREEWRRAAREKHNLALIMMDIDKFKLVNDTAGHPEGDKVLSGLAECLSLSLKRPSDFLARYGGEEFVALLPNNRSPSMIGEKLRADVEDLKLPHPAFPPSGIITISVGVSVCFPSPSGDLKPKHLLQAADQAMYASKSRGGNCVTFYPKSAGDSAALA